MPFKLGTELDISGPYDGELLLYSPFVETYLVEGGELIPCSPFVVTYLGEDGKLLPCILFVVAYLGEDRPWEFIRFKEALVKVKWVSCYKGRCHSCKCSWSHCCLESLFIVPTKISIDAAITRDDRAVNCGNKILIYDFPVRLYSSQC